MLDINTLEMNIIDYKLEINNQQCRFVTRIPIRCYCILILNKISTGRIMIQLSKGLFQGQLLMTETLT